MFAMLLVALGACGSKAGSGPMSATSKPSPAPGGSGEASTGGTTMGTGGTWRPGTAATSDPDGDGVFDDKDRCPDEPEDRDAVEDEDGCPDPAPPR
jgi:hypothetical protein